MYYGIVGVTALAFICSMELMPEINQQMKLVPFTEEFKTKMTSAMLLDYGLCYVIEIVLKRLFSDFRPRDIAERRADQLEREAARKAVESVKKAREAAEAEARRVREEEEKGEAQVREFERRLEQRRLQQQQQRR
jgi:cation-transporting ATPase 13A1